MSTSTSTLSETYTQLLQATKHTWSTKKVTPSYNQKVLRANQIQYRLRKLDDGRIELQAINILDNYRDSLDPVPLDASHSSLLRAVLSKKWVLAETLELAKQTLDAPKFALFCSYILYYDILLDHFILTKDGILEYWLLIEKRNHGRHHEALPESGEQDFDVKKAVKASCSRWGIVSLYNEGADMTRLEEEQVMPMRKHVLKWFEDLPIDS